MALQFTGLHVGILHNYQPRSHPATVRASHPVLANASRTMSGITQNLTQMGASTAAYSPHFYNVPVRMRNTRSTANPTPAKACVFSRQINSFTLRAYWRGHSASQVAGRLPWTAKTKQTANFRRVPVSASGKERAPYWALREEQVSILFCKVPVFS